MRLLPIFIALLALSATADELNLNPEWAKSVGKCSVKSPKGKVWIVKQWHLSPATDTKDVTASKALPQAKNQKAIYEMIADWVGADPKTVILAEGCEGEINQSFKPNYNGWNMESLRKAASGAEYGQILTHVPMKVEAKFTDKVATWCGDNEALVKRHSLAFSDARGLIGYKTRMEQFKDQPEKVKPYLESFLKISKLPENTKLDSALKTISAKLNAQLSEIKKVFALRNESFVQAAQKHGGAQSILVIGGLHAQDLKSRFEQANYDCEIVEPVGYVAEDEKLFTDLEKLL